MAVVDMKKLSPEFAAQFVELKEEAKERKKSGKGKDGSGGRGRKKNLPEQIPEGNRTSRSERETRTAIARAAGTNAKYIADVEKIAESHPEKVPAAPGSAADTMSVHCWRETGTD